MKLNWISTALLSSAMQAAVSVVDSHLLSKRMLELRTLILAMGVIQALYGLLLYILFPWPANIPAAGILSVIAASIFGIGGSLTTLLVLQKEEVSRVVPIGHITPVYIAIIATIFLDENLTYLHWLAIIIVTAGALIVSTEKNQVIASSSMKRPFSLLFIATLFGALGAIFTKITLRYMSFWNMYSMAILIASVIVLAISARPDTFNQWREMKRRSSTLALIVLNEIAGMSASVLYVRAVSLGPVSLVSTIGGVRPFLVIIYSAILSLVLPGFLLELPGKRTIIFRLIAIAMIVGGVSIISLN